MATVVTVPLAQQLQVPFIDMRSLYEVRERPSRMYSWTALVASQILVEVPWNILGSSLFYLCWYWTVGYDSDRAGYTYLMIGVLFPMYYTSIGQATAAMCPNAEIAAILFSLLFSFVITLCVFYPVPMHHKRSLTGISFQQRCHAAVLTTRLVEVDVPSHSLYLPYRGFTWSRYSSILIPTS